MYVLFFILYFYPVINGACNDPRFATPVNTFFPAMCVFVHSARVLARMEAVLLALGDLT